MKDNDITLAPGATAEPNTCGSCKFFKRDMNNGPYEMARGNCEIRMPPLKQYFRTMTYEETGERDRAPNWVSDSAGCDLYRHDGKQYIVQRYIPSKP